MRIIIRFILNLAGLWVAAYFVKGFHLAGSWKGLLVAGLVLAVLNLLVKPILKLISTPLIIVTLGLFSLVINAIILWLASQFAGAYINIDNLGALLWATIIISVANIISHWI